MGSTAIIGKTVHKTVRWVTNQLQRSVPYEAHNPFLEGPFAPIGAEYTETNLHVQGEIPKALKGLLLRMGPNPLDVENPAVYHWFVGDGMVHALRLDDGKAVWYRNRYIGVDSVNQKLGKPSLPGPRRGVQDIVNTNIIGHAGKLWALIEAGAYPVELDAELNSVRHGLFNSKTSLPFTAHPHVDPDTGTIHAVCYDAFMNNNKLCYIQIDKDGQLIHHVSIPVRHGPMIHDCAITQSKVLVLDLPTTFSYTRVLKGSKFPYIWNPRHKARIGILAHDGKAKDIRWFSVDPCCIFHTSNAFDLANGDVVLDAAVHDRTFDQSLQGPVEKDVKVTFERWTFKFATGQVERKVISDIAQEFPRMDERRAGKPYRYAYTLSIGEGAVSVAPNYLIRHDLQTGELIEHHYGADKLTGEVIFVPRHPNAAENDGWLMSYVHDIHCGFSQVVILDAQKMGEAPLAVIDLPIRVPLGFHGNWVADQG